MFTNISSFLENEIPVFLAGIERLHIFLGTYNSVSGHESGLVRTGLIGLTMQIQSGDLWYAPITDGERTWPPPFAAISGTATKLEVKPQEEISLFAVIYAGLTGFDRAVNSARSIKQQNPGAKVAVVTCDCDPRKAEEILRPLLDSHELDFVIVDHRCGGYGAMREILDGIVRIWPIRAGSTIASIE
jgi:hypothetical protein